MTDYPVSADRSSPPCSGHGRPILGARRLAGRQRRQRPHGRLLDVDIQFIVEDAHVEDAFAVIHARWRCCRPSSCATASRATWHGHSQEVMQLRDAGPLAVVDLSSCAWAAMPTACSRRSATASPWCSSTRTACWWRLPWTRKHMAKVKARLETLRVIFPLFQGFVTKASLRGFGVETMLTYYQFTIRFLVELLRIRYCPDRFDYGLRYLDRDLPAICAHRSKTWPFPPRRPRWKPTGSAPPPSLTERSRTSTRDSGAWRPDAAFASAPVFRSARAKKDPASSVPVLRLGRRRAGG